MTKGEPYTSCWIFYGERFVHAEGEEEKGRNATNRHSFLHHLITSSMNWYDNNRWDLTKTADDKKSKEE